MSTTASTQKPTATALTQSLICSARRRPPLGVNPVTTSHRDLRDRLLSCAG